MISQFSGFHRVVAVRKVTFADGSTETLARFLEVPDGVRAPGASRIPVDAPERAERCRRVAEARARRELRWAIRSIGGDHLLTCTFQGMVEDPAVARRVWEYFIKMMRARYPAWKFVAVMELQKRGCIHFHAAVKGWQDVKYLRAVWRRAAGDFGGNIDVRSHQRRFGGEGGGVWVQRRLISYMAKYLGKAFEWLPKHAQRFTASVDRVRPAVLRWWIEYAVDDAEVIRTVYAATAGESCSDVRQWMSPDGGAYMVSCDGPPKRSALPF